MTRGVLVAGEALIDLVPAGDGLYRAQPGGAPANVAVALARLGTRSCFAGALGGDTFATTLERRLADAGADLALCGRSSLPTALAVADPSPAGNGYHFHTADTATFRLPDNSASAGRFDAVYVGGLAAVAEPAATVVAATARAGATGSLLVADPNVRDDRALDPGLALRRLRHLCAQAHVVKVSDEDVLRLWPDARPEESCRRLAAGGRLVVLTRGARGSTAYAGHTRPLSVPAVPVTVVNTIGAGDAFTAAVLHWLLDTGAHRPGGPHQIPRDAVEAMLRFASQVAASVCADAGTEPVPDALPQQAAATG